MKLDQAEVQIPAAEAKKLQYLAIVKHLLSKLPDTTCRDTVLPGTAHQAGSILQANVRHEDVRCVTAAERRSRHS